MRILFLCVANSARSQMAEGLARAEFGDSADVLSAGSQPQAVHPLAIEAMREIGIDISRHQPTSIDVVDISTVDMIVTLCAEEVCPLVLGHQRQYHWPLRDPAGASLSKPGQIALFRQVRDELQKRIVALKDTLNRERKIHAKRRR